MISRGSVIFGVCRFDRLGDQIDALADASITVLRMIAIACGAVPARRVDFISAGSALDARGHCRGDVVTVGLATSR